MPESTLEHQASQVASSGTYSDTRSPPSNTPKPRHMQPDEVITSVFENLTAFHNFKEETEKLHHEEISDLLSKIHPVIDEEPPICDWPVVMELFLKLSQAYKIAGQLMEKGANLLQDRISSQCPEIYMAIFNQDIDELDRIEDLQRRNAALQAQQELFQHHKLSSNHQNGNSCGAIPLAPDFQPSESELLRNADKIQATSHHRPPLYNEVNDLEMADIKPSRSHWRRILNRLSRIGA
ncbi:hypothetical protein N7466_010601 [Penicillium verhagenii]|uniref:uncharacterized protein n=1 Tax=Penicillium verhagenii TaxID=1562060 RepID=UPI002545AC63|nr:uncharacterized protein N7466_010601 [Penicillium verhagenii]KAJ5918609.1 hypothetical protein N7466_010601 [Penicillium verhagenii]